MILFEEASSSRIAVLGIQPQQDHLLLQGLRQRALGALGELGPGCVYLSRRLRDRLGAALGDWITLSVPTASGALAAADFRVVGILGRGAPWQDYFIYVPLGDLQHLLGLGEAVQQIKVTFPEPKQPLSALRAQAEQLLPPASRLRVQTYRESGSFFLGILTANRVLLESMNLILLFAVALGVAGTQLLSVNERRREIGTMLALGTSRAQVAGVFLLEGAFLALAFGLLGAWAGAGVTAYLARHGLGIPIEAFTWMTGTDRLFPRLSWAAFPAALGELVLVTALAGLYPALQAARLEPTRALHGGEQ
jgi:ABC-type lipoprotein release transport system permease subunit